MLEYFAAASMFVALLIGLFAPSILLFFTRTEYVSAAPYVIALLMYVGPIGFATQFFNIGLFVGKKTHLISFILLAAALVNITLNLLWDGTYGAWGAAWATVIAGFVQMTLTFFISRRTLFVDYRWLRLSGLLACYLSINLYFLLNPDYSWIGAAFSVTLFCACVFAFGIARVEQVQIAVSAIRRRLLS
jgi:O-antigen/teichoic acid export membrane protein